MRWHRALAGIGRISAVVMLGLLLSGHPAWAGGEADLVATSEKPAPRLVVQTGHGNTIDAVAFSPDGRLLVSASYDATIRLWDVASGREVRTFGGHLGEVHSVAFSPDGLTLASGGSDHTLKRWELATGRELSSVTDAGGDVFSTSFSADGLVLLSSSCTTILPGNSAENREVNSVKVRDVATGKELVLSGHKTCVRSAAISRDKQTVASSSDDGVIKLWQTDTGRELRTITLFTDGEGIQIIPMPIAFSPDGRTLASGSNDHSVRLWDVKTGACRLTMRGHQNTVRSVAFSPDGRTLASGSDDASVKIWDANSGRELRAMDGYFPVVSVAFDASGNQLAATDGNRIKLWNLDSDERRNLINDAASSAYSVAASPDGHTLFSADMRGLRLWNLENGRQMQTLGVESLNPEALAFSPNGRLLVSGSHDNTVKVWDFDAGMEPSYLKGHTHNVDTLAFSLDGRLLASGSFDKTAIVWETGTRKKIRTFDVADHVKSVQLSPDGKLLATSSQSDTLKIWEVDSGTLLVNRTIPGRVIFSPDWSKMARFIGDRVEMSDRSAGKAPVVLDHHGMIKTVTFSRSGEKLATAGYDKNIKVWDTGGRNLCTLQGHTGSVDSVAFSPAGDLLYSASINDNSTRIWRLADCALAATLYSFRDGTWVVTDPEGRFDTADLEEIKGLHWVMPDDPLTPVPLEAFMRDYYEPGLLSRILHGEKFKPVRALMELNRVQPEVKIVSVTPDSKDPTRALIEVSVAGARKEYQRAGKKVAMSTAVNDLRLFRDGQLVGHLDGQVVKQDGKIFNVRMPSAMSGKEITFSAYAFNDDRVKSATARKPYRVPASVVVRKGNAYLVHMGVNRFDNPAWDLRYAANDSRLMRRTLSEKIAKTGAYQRTVALSLDSDEGERHADKALLHAVFDRLAGKEPSPLLKELPGAEQLQAATPDDLVLFTFSGHGYADGGGNFYLLTQDTGPGSGKEVTDDLLRRSISSEELSQWLKDVDAGDLTLIVDACQSAASVQGKDFKPGPMGSRGLGQLSFDKGMRILAASQADEYALENDRIKQGLLSFALVSNGIDEFAADYAPKDGKILLDEWLRYGVSRVPGLAEEVRTGKVRASARGSERAVVRINSSGGGPSRPAQQPALFDFAKNRRPVEIAGP